MTTPKGTEGSFQVTARRTLDFREIWENVAIGTRHCRFDEFLYLFDLLKCIDYWIPKLTFEILICAEYVPFFDNLSWNSCILQALIAMQLMTNFCFASGFLLKSIIIKLSNAEILEFYHIDVSVIPCRLQHCQCVLWIARPGNLFGTQQ